MASKSKKGNSGGPAWIPAVVLAACVIVCAAAVFFLKWPRLVLLLVAMLTGIPLGLTANPVLAGLGEKLYALMLSAGAARFLPHWHGDIVSVLSPGGGAAAGMFVLLAVLCISSAAAQGRAYRFDWKEVLLMGVGGAVGMYLAGFALRGGPLARSVFGGLFNNPLFIKVFLALLALLTLAHYVAHRGGGRRHWLLCLPLGPLVGFWSFYVTRSPVTVMFFLTVFVILVVLNAGARDTLFMLPPVLLILWAARLYFLAGGVPSSLLHIAGGDAHLLDLLAAAAGIALAVFLCLRVIIKIRDSAAEVVFACGLALFLVLFFAGA